MTLLSDTGWAYAAQMRGEILRRAPGVSVIDLTHEVTPHAVVEGAFLLRQILSRFPAGGTHVAIVDPGVGGRRAAVAVALADGSHLVGPDNGLLTPAADAVGIRGVVRIEPMAVAAGGSRAPTFDGRDLFAPAAAMLACGRPVHRLGRPWRLAPGAIPEPVLGRTLARGEIVHVDRFGNAVSNVPAAWPAGNARHLSVRVGRRRRSLPRVRTYSELPAGAVGVLASSFGTLEVSARELPAARRLGLAVGTALTFERPARRIGK